MNSNEYRFSEAVVTLLKGIVNEATDTRMWNTILDQQVYIENYVSKIGLKLMIHKQDGYAYLKQNDYTDDEKSIPRLVTRRQLKYLTSLILVLLRKELMDLNKNIDSGRYIISKSSINVIEKMGFIRLLKNSNDEYEISPLLRGFVDAQWLQDLDEKLKGYRDYVKGNSKTGEFVDE